jgi:hypothetical protein
MLIRVFFAILDTSPLPRVGTGDGNELMVAVLNTIFGILAAISFITIIFAGFKYVISRGEPDKISQAKDTILYAVVGLIIAFSAFGIVNFLLKSI